MTTDPQIKQAEIPVQDLKVGITITVLTIQKSQDSFDVFKDNALETFINLKIV